MNRLVKPRTLFVTLTLLCLLAIWLSLALGPVSLPLFDTLRAGARLIGLPVAGDGLEQAELILGQIRLPRTLLGLAVGAVLALSGVAMQGLFRNPLADPAWSGCLRGPRSVRQWRLSAARGWAVFPRPSALICYRCVHFLVAWG